MYLAFHDFLVGTDCMEGHEIIGRKERLVEKFCDVLYLTRLDIEPQNGTFYVADDHLRVDAENVEAFLNSCKVLDTIAIIMKSQTPLHQFLDVNPYYKKSAFMVVTPSKQPSEIICMELMHKMNHTIRAMFQDMNMINAKFFQMALRNVGIEEMLGYFKEVVGYPAAIFDENFQCIIATDTCLRTQGRIKATSENLYLNNLYFSKQRILLADAQEYSLVSFPISFQGKVRAYLSILEQGEAFGNVDYLILESAASSILMEMKHSFGIKTIQERNINGFLYDLFYRGEKHLDAFGNLASSFGFSPESDFFVTIMEVHAGSAKHPMPRTLSNVLGPTVTDEVFSLISNEINPTGICILLGQLGGHVIALCKLEENPSESFLKIRNCMERIGISLNKYFHKSALFAGVGSPAGGITQAAESYKNAHNALVYAKTIARGNESMTVVYQDNMLINLLGCVGDRNRLDDIIPKGLKDIYTYDLAHQTQFLATLSAYFECDCNARLASKRMFIHYKTMLYRLNKITEISKCNFSNSDEKMHIMLGLTIMKLLQMEPFGLQ